MRQKKKKNVILKLKSYLFSKIRRISDRKVYRCLIVRVSVLVHLQLGKSSSVSSFSHIIFLFILSFTKAFYLHREAINILMDYYCFK